MSDVGGTIDEVVRRSYGKLIAILASRNRDLQAAEDALSEATASALIVWPRIGCPANPEAWLLTVARRKQLDAIRREVSVNSYESAFAIEPAPYGEIPDRRLALLFGCAHPAIDRRMRAPLMLQVVLGLDASRIASAFLVSSAAMGKQLVRAKAKIRRAGIPFCIPQVDELPERTDAVLDAIYAVFNHAPIDLAGSDAACDDLSSEGLFLARLVNDLLPCNAEALGLSSLMLYVASRSQARRGRQGEYIAFAEQDPALWDGRMIQEAEKTLRRAASLCRPGRYQIEACLQSAHVHRRIRGESNWGAVVNLYDLLASVTGSPVVAINRALAVAELNGADDGLKALQKVAGDPRVHQYQPYWAARADLLVRKGAFVEAIEAYGAAIRLARDPAVRSYLQYRASAIGCTRS